MCALDASGHGIGCQVVHTPYTVYIYILTIIQAREAIQISPPNLSKGGRLLGTTVYFPVRQVKIIWLPESTGF